MGIEISSERQRRIKVRTYNYHNSYTYRYTVYRTPDGDSIIVDDGDMTQKVRDALEDEGYEIREEKPKRYCWSKLSWGPTDDYDGVFTVEEVVGSVEPDATRYETDCGHLTTTYELDVGATYETYQKDMKHFGYRKVDDS